VTALILASASRTRLVMLEAAGLDVVAAAPNIDEAGLKTLWRDHGAEAGRIAAVLAEAKALEVSRRCEGALVIGADQVLDCQGTLFDKPADDAAARRQLLALRGKAHRLLTAAAIARDGRTVWEQLDTAELTMRRFSESFLDRYLARAGAAVLTSVGAYQLEGQGAQLFDQVEGNHFTILGLPLLPLLAFLRNEGVIET
jgi:septum formation protein